MDARGVYIPLGHTFGHAASLPVASVHPLWNIMPVVSPVVAIHRPLLMHTSPLAQQPLCFALGLHGVYVLSSAVPFRS